MKNEKTMLERLLEAQKQIGKVVKNAKNPHFKSNYADVNAIVAAVEPILNENGLILMQPIDDGYVVTRIIDATTGEKIESKLPLGNQAQPQAMGSQITYYRRYTLQSLLALQVEDDDANQATEAKTPAPAKGQKPMFTQDRFKAAFEALANAETIRQKYTLTPEMEEAYNLYVESQTV